MDIRLFLFFCMVLVCHLASAQLRMDSLQQLKIKKQDSLSQIIDKRPQHALLYGLLIPGGGQLYNKRWLKFPLAIGGYVGMGLFIKFNQDLFKKYDGYYQTAVNAPDLMVQITPTLKLDYKAMKKYRDQARDARDRSIFLGIGVHFIIALEAYVDAHLKNFNMDENLSFRVFPQTGGLGFAYNIR